MFDYDLLEDVEPSTVQVAPAAPQTFALLLGREPSGPRSTDVEVHVSTIGAGIVAKLRLLRSAVVDDVKQELERKRGVSAAEQRLLLGTTVLEGPCSLREAAHGVQGPLQLTMVHVPGARRVALSGGREGALLLWDLAHGEPLKTLNDGASHATCVDMAWPTRRALSGGSDGSLRLWDLESASVLRTLRGHAAEVTCLAADWEAQRCVSGCRDGSLRYWDLETCTTITAMAGHTEAALCVSFNDQEQRAASGGADCALVVWDLDQGEAVLRLEGHVMPINCVAANFETRPEPVAVTGSFGILRVWSLSHFPFHWDFAGQSSTVTCLSVDWASLSVLSGCMDSTLLCGHLNLNQNLIEHKRWLRGHTAPVTCVAANWPRQRAASGGEDGMVRLWDMRRGTALQALRGHSDHVLCTALSLEGPEEDEPDDAGSALELLSDLPNLAHCCPAKASSAKSPSRAAGFAVDGRRDTRWTSIYLDDQWLAVDLGKTCKVARVDIKWEAACAARYEVQASLDGERWSTLATERGREGWVVTELPEEAPARWVRMYGRQRATKFGFSIWALCVY